jgi:hypothetical protein
MLENIISHLLPQIVVENETHVDSANFCLFLHNVRKICHKGTNLRPLCPVVNQGLYTALISAQELLSTAMFRLTGMYMGSIQLTSILLD